MRHCETSSIPHMTGLARPLPALAARDTQILGRQRRAASRPLLVVLAWLLRGAGGERGGSREGQIRERRGHTSWSLPVLHIVRVGGHATPISHLLGRRWRWRRRSCSRSCSRRCCSRMHRGLGRGGCRRCCEGRRARGRRAPGTDAQQRSGHLAEIVVEAPVDSPPSSTGTGAGRRR